MCRPTDASTPEALPSVPHQYWIIHGATYDLASYIKSHPGGDEAILLGRGRDCTELFEQYHVLNNKHLRVLERFRVTLPAAKVASNNLKEDMVSTISALDGEEADAAAVVGIQQPAAPARVAHQADPFYEDIKAMVRAHGNTKMSTPFVILHCLHVVGLVWSMKLWLEGAFISAFVLPYFLWVLCAAMVHDGGHFAHSKRPLVNKLLTHAGALFTNSVGCWYLQHNILHHSYTNLVGKDGDLDSHHPYMRIHPEQSMLPANIHHAVRFFSHLIMYNFAHIGLTMISPISYFRGVAAQKKGTADAKQAQDAQTVAQYHGTVMLQLVTVLAFYITPFLRFEFSRALLLTLLPTFMMSIAFMVIAQVSHIQMDAEAPSADLEKLHWARRMALTSVDYSQESTLWAYLTIGLNMQSLHHIVPGVSYSQLTRMYPAYRAICAKHGIKLLERRNLAHAFWTHLQTLWVLSKTHSFVEVARKLA
ncbi:hypothetical protein HYH02_005671 [Chlamydomonas schloesseri]|uniref:Cytochrome b5 heme-binding domain-containing protein n=1 Tax=Chlamydomonas schloesseri TaxID=2026947 RepID=A0A836B7H0_9CHLO|nr:hypothetical protein HYH02_005671 [Chlamydomonas schloesseri]|eukprot:KAG2449529.1 hypothetical protein HYH02_005671 [Chlamydomonas schloesseri]